MPRGELNYTKINMVRAVIYSRYSSEAQSDSFSTEAQLEIGRDFITKQGWELVEEYIDEALSGLSDKRSAFQRMIVDASNREFDRVVVYAYDRFSRNRYDQVTYKHELRQYGVTVVSVTQPIDHDNPDSILLEALYEGMAESQSRKLARDTVRGSIQAAKRGFWVGGQPPYGYDITQSSYNGAIKSKLKVNTEESKIVQDIYKMYLKGDAGFIEIAKRLNVLGITRNSSNKWTSSTVRNILTNERYTGSMVWGKRKDHRKRGLTGLIPDVVVEHSHAAIITKKDYDTAQEIMKSRRIQKETLNQYDYLLSGLIYCQCGHNMVGHSAKSGKYHYYVCNRKVKQGAASCDSKMINRDNLDNKVISVIKDHVCTVENIESVARAMFQAIKNMGRNNKKQILEINKIIAKKQKMYNRLIDCIALTEDLDISDLAPRIKSLKQEIDTLNAKKASIHIKREKVTFTPELKKKVVNGYVKLVIDYIDSHFLSKGNIRLFIDRIDVEYPNYSIKWKLPEPDRITSGSVLDRDAVVVRSQRYQELFYYFRELRFVVHGSLAA